MPKKVQRLIRAVWYSVGVAGPATQGPNQTRSLAKLELLKSLWQPRISSPDFHSQPFTSSKVPRSVLSQLYIIYYLRLGKRPPRTVCPIDLFLCYQIRI
jgi:hypothetical protein